MATSNFPPSLEIAVLQVFRSRIGANSAWTVEEIWDAVCPDHFSDPFFFWREYLFTSYDSPQQWLNSSLLYLAELGLVAQAESSEESSGFPRWRLGQSWSPPEPPSGGGDGGGGRIGPSAEDGDGDEGGGGLQEALGHPVLLALSQDDFDELVDGLFEEVQP